MKQFRIDEFERERILNLHENATKRQYLNEQGDDCIMINKVDGIGEVVKDVSKLNWLITLEGKKVSKVCKGRPGTNYTFRSEENPELTVPSFTLDGSLKIGSKGA